MTNSRTTRKALLSSALALLMCVAMLIATTFAWFTDTASTSVNKIQAGTLDVALEMATDWDDDGSVKTWASAEGKTLSFKKAANAPEGEQVLWEPGCTYELPAIRVVNKGNLAFKYKLVVSGAVGDTELLDAIDFTVVGSEGVETALNDMEGILLPEGKNPTAGTDEKVKYSDANGITIKGHMKEDASNTYQGLSVSGIAITVYAQQYTYEYDSYNKTYDEQAESVITSSPFSNYVNVTGTKAADTELVLKDNETSPTITATIPADSTSASGLALIKEPTANPDSVTINLGENAISTDVKIIDTSTKQTISAAGDTYFTISIQLGQVELLKFYHKGVELIKADSKAALTSTGLYYYDFDSGVVTFTTKDFSAFTAKIKYSGGNGSDENPYLLGTANDMSGLANNTGDATGDKYFKLVDNIDLTGDWNKIDSFKGTINGSGKTVTLGTENGLIGTVSSGATIENLTLETNGAQYALAANVYGSDTNKTTISEVTVTGKVDGPVAMIAQVTTERTGTAPSSVEVSLTDCTNKANVTSVGSNRAVGLVGTGYGAYIEFVRCHNEGNMSVTNTNAEAHAAGIAGYMMNSSNQTGKYVFDSCTNIGKIFGEITADSTKASNEGGIVSTAHQGMFIITNCTNSGEITSKRATGKNSANAGGIVGRVNTTTTIAGCSNTGKISATTKSTNTAASGAYAANAGGIVGNAKASGGTTIGTDASGNISPCSNKGEIVATATDGGNANAGGIAGYAESLAKIDACSNECSVSAGGSNTKYASAGGIVGHAYGDSTAKKGLQLGLTNADNDACSNNGSVAAVTGVSGGRASAGGIVGQTYNNCPAKIGSCSNAASVSATATKDGTADAGGVLGYACTVSSTTNVGPNASNSGNVTATAQVAGGTANAGGILGEATKNVTVKLDTCSNSGTILANYVEGATANAGVTKGTSAKNPTVANCTEGGTAETKLITAN